MIHLCKPFSARAIPIPIRPHVLHLHIAHTAHHSMKAWAQTLDPNGASGIRFLADPHLSLTNALDLAFDGTAIFGGHRSKRYALVIEDGKVKETHIEPDNTGLNGRNLSAQMRSAYDLAEC